MKIPTYVLGAAIVWTAILFATAVVLGDTPYFAQVLPLLAGGAVWFVILVPGAMRARQAGSSGSNPRVADSAAKVTRWFNTGTGIVFGAGLGLVVGTLLGNPAQGIVFGMMIGVVVGAIAEGRPAARTPHPPAA